MVSCLNASQSDVNTMAQYDKNFIMKLKNEDVFYLEYLDKYKDKNNTYGVMSTLAKRNHKFMATKLFKKSRKSIINNYVDRCKYGKIKLCGDYCVMLGNGYEMLFYAIGVDVLADSFEHPLVGNQIYTTLHDTGREYVLFRNPTTSPSNILVSENKKIPDIDKYFNLTDNICVVNSIDFPIQDILSSCDFDSDTIVVFDNPKLLEVAKRTYGKYLPCINDVGDIKNKYEATNENLAIIGSELSKSQQNIGKTVNNGQWAMSAYWDAIAKGEDPETIKDYDKKINVATILSTVCIDMAKKKIDINPSQEINAIGKGLPKNKPLFFKGVNGSSDSKKYECPMDYCYNYFCNLDIADPRNTVELNTLIIKPKNLNTANRKQQKAVEKMIEELTTNINGVYEKHSKDEKDDSDAKKERERELDEEVDECLKIMSKRKIKKATMYQILMLICDDKLTSNLSGYHNARFMQMLLNTQRDVFLSMFRRN